MRFCLEIFCREGKSISRNEIAEFLQRGKDSRDGIAFDPLPGAPESLLEDWESLTIGFQPNARSAIVTRSVGSDLFKKEIGELLSFVRGCAESGRQRDLQQRLEHVSQVLLIHIEQNAVDANGWRMLDKLESYLAHTLDGVIYARGEGFFDSDLQHIDLLPLRSVVVPTNRPQ